MKSIASDPKATGVIGAIGGVVAGLVVGVVVASGPSTNYTSPESPNVLEPPPISAPPRAAAISPEVDEWHKTASGSIGDIIWLSGPAVGDFASITTDTLCENLESSVKRLEEAGVPPSDTLSVLLQNWMSAMESVLVDCPGIPPEIGVRGFESLTQRSSYEMSLFLSELDRLVDLSRAP